MHTKQYCEGLVRFKESGICIISFLGRKWFAIKLLCIIAVMIFLNSSVRSTNNVGFLLLGYLIGAIGISLRSFYIARNNWKLQEQFIDWNKVHQYLKDMGKITHE